MPEVAHEVITKRTSLIGELDTEFEPWRQLFQELARFFLPHKYEWLTTTSGAALLSSTENSSAGLTRFAHPSAAGRRNNALIDSSGLDALRTLSHGLMNGVTSPSRPWFRLRLAAFPEDRDEYPLPIRIFLEEAERRMLMVMAESNFYNALAILYLDIACFGSALALIYEDFDEVIRVYNSPVGEFRFLQDHRRMVYGLARVFHLKVHQIVEQFGLENCSQTVQSLYNSGGASRLQSFTIYHLIEPNNNDAPRVGGRFKFRELYWEPRGNEGKLLALKGFNEKPMMAVRWVVTGNDSYGTSPAQDALSDVKQLQVEVKQKLQGLEKLVRPPIIADVALQGRPDALLPGGVSYANLASTAGAKPIYTVNPPIGEIRQDVAELIDRIRRILYNNLFRNVSDLSTVRSATEIAERKAEDMVMLGPVLERFENEALDPAIRRVFNIMLRKGMLPDLPEGLTADDLEIRYVSILADAQRASATGPMERYMQTVGQLGAIAPDLLKVPNFEELLREYAARLNIPAKTQRSREEVQAAREAEAEQLAAQQAALVGRDLTQAAQNLSETEIGAGNSAIDELLG